MSTPVTAAIEFACKALATTFPLFSKSRNEDEKKMLMQLWASALGPFGPETICRAAARVCITCTRPQPVLADMFTACLEMSEDPNDEWSAAWNEVLDARGRVCANRESFAAWIKGNPDKRAARIAKAFQTDLIPPEGFPNMATIRAQFREAYEADKRRERRRAEDAIVSGKAVQNLIECEVIQISATKGLTDAVSE